MNQVTWTEIRDYENFGKAVRIANGELEVVVTLDIGPRVIRFAVPGGKNVFGDKVPVSEIIGDETWRIYGGHRIWHSPEAFPRSYMPDNGKVEKYEKLENGILVFQKEEPWTQMQKVLEVRVLEDHVEVTSSLVNKGAWPIEAAVWSLSIGAPGGRLVAPVITRNTGYLPNRTVVLWPDSVMNDKRVYWGACFTVVDCDPSVKDAFKFGYPDEYGWAAYFNNDTCFVKKFNHVRNASYPDLGCSWETFTGDWGMELESLSPLTLIKPGKMLSHKDEWYLFDKVGKPAIDERVITETLKPIAVAAGLTMPVPGFTGYRSADVED